MLEVRYFLVNLLCVFVPLFFVEARYAMGRKSENQRFGIKPLLIISIPLSSFLCTLFNFPISNKISLNLSIVLLAIGFFLLSWQIATAILGIYVLSQITLSSFILSRGHFSYHVVTTIISALPRAMVMIVIFAVIMATCSVLTKKQRFSRRASAFIGSLLLYTLIDYMFVRHVHHFTKFEIVPFIGFVLVFNFTFVLVVHSLIATQKNYMKRMENERIEKLELISQLAASVAHEIRNPLTVVQGFTQLLLDMNNHTKSRDYLKTMLSELARAESVISNYLDIAKSPLTEVHSQFDLSTVVEYVVQILSSYSVSKNIEIRTNLEQNLMVCGSQEQVVQAVVNLIKNAIEAYDHAGTIDVSLRYDGDSIELMISDFGRGIPRPHLMNLGHPYYSTKSHGTGLGLTFVYKVFSEMHGTVQVKSQEGVGTTFVVRIPRAEDLNEHNILHA